MLKVSIKAIPVVGTQPGPDSPDPPPRQAGVGVDAPAVLRVLITLYSAVFFSLYSSELCVVSHRGSRKVPPQSDLDKSFSLPVFRGSKRSICMNFLYEFSQWRDFFSAYWD